MSTATVVITGASRGIGAAVARALAAEYRLVLVGRDAARLSEVAADCPDARIVTLDLTDHAAVSADPDLAALDRLDALVHCAGVAELGSVAASGLEQWQRTWEVNVLAVVGLTRRLLPALRAAGGHVVAVNSGAGLTARAGWGSYAASKFALRAFADALREEEPDLRVTSVFPGRVDTDMQRAVVTHEGGEYDPARFLRPETVADAVHRALTTAVDGHPTEIVLRPRGR